MHTSIKMTTPCEFINVTPINPLISRCQIKVCYVSDEPNRNRSIITKEVARDMANSLPGSPIVGYYNEEKGDFEEALTAANAIGDDTLQMEGQGYVVPESFTHGTSEQRMRWFKKGFANGTLKGGDTFNAEASNL